MKKKVVIALIATLTLTLGSFGTAFAMNSTPTIELQTNENLKQAEEPEHTHTWGDEEYIVTKPAEYEQIKVVDKEAVYEQNWVVDKEAVYDEVKVVDKEAWTEDITAIHTVCYNCGLDYTAEGYTPEQLAEHVKQHMLNGESGQYGSREVVVDTIEHPEEFHMETVLVSPEEGHYENGDLISPEEFHYENGALISPEEGYWEHTCSVCGEIQNVETGEVIKPGTLPDEPENPGTDDPTTEEPENPNPDDPTTEEPGKPNPDDPTTEEPENPNTGSNTGEQPETPSEDTQNPTDETETDNNKQDQQSNTDKTQSTDNKEQTDTAVTAASNENAAPQTGDTTSLIYLATLAGSAVTGGVAFRLRRKSRK